MMLTRKVWSALCLRMEPKTNRFTAVAGLIEGLGVTPGGVVRGVEWKGEREWKGDMDE